MSNRKISENETVVDEDFMIVLKARESVADEKKWCQGHINLFDGPHCWAGWIGEAAGMSLSSIIPLSRHQIFRRIAKKLGFEDIGQMVEFNDMSISHHAFLQRLDQRIEAWRKTL